MRLGLTPEELTNEQYAKAIQEWAYVQKVEMQMIEGVFKKVIGEVIENGSSSTPGQELT